MPPARHGRNLRSWRRKVEHARRVEQVCWICGDLLSPDMPAGHRKSITLDHIVPLSLGGDIHGETRPACLSCNSRRHNRPEAVLTPPRTSRDW